MNPAHLPRITIVTPSYNQGDFIEETINSILEQGYSNLQYIVMDGGSTDQTVDILKKYGRFLDHWESVADKGQSHAINKGLKRANGVIFNWINSDDGLKPGALKAIGEHYLQAPFDALLTQTTFLRNGKEEGLNGSSNLAETPALSALELGLNQPGHFYNTSLVKQLNGVDERYAYVMDLDLWIRFLLNFGQDGVVRSELISSFFRFHGESKSEIEGWGPGSAFDLERQAMYVRLARYYPQKQAAKAFEFLFPNHRLKSETNTLQSSIPLSNLAEWSNAMLFPKAQRAFYAEDFKRAHKLASGLILNQLPPSAKRDAKAMRKHSLLKMIFQGIRMKRAK